MKCSSRHHLRILARRWIMRPVANDVRGNKNTCCLKSHSKHVFELSNSSDDIRISIDATKALEYINLLHNLHKQFSDASMSANGSMTRNSPLRLLQGLEPSALYLKKYFWFGPLLERISKHDFLSWVLWSLEGSQPGKLNCQSFSSHSLCLSTRLIFLKMNLDVLRRWESLWHNLALTVWQSSVDLCGGWSKLFSVQCQNLSELWFFWSVHKNSSYL